MSKQKLEKFTPTIREEKNIKIETNYKSTLDDIADKDGIIETKLNKESMIQAVSHKLYRNAESGFRELLNNEIRACQIARDQYKAKPYIKVSLSTLDRKLVIHGFNSQGITEEVFAKILREIGTSATESKKDGRIPFGMGFFGFLKLSDIAIVQTRCIGNSDCYGFMAKGGLFFKKIQKPTFKETGTKISLTLKPKTNYEKIVKTLVEVSKVSGITTYFELNAHKGRIAKFSNGINQLEQTTFKEIFDNTLNSDNSYLTSHVDNDDYEAYISVGIDDYESISNDRIKKLHLINSPIEAILDEDDYDDYDYESGRNNRLDDDDDYDDDEDDEDDGSRKITYKKGRIDQIYFHSFVINMKKEKLFVPHQDRERLTPEGEKQLRQVVLDLYDKALKSIKPCHDLKSWFKHPHKYFISAGSNKIQLKDTDEKTKKLTKLLNEEYSNAFGKSETKEIKTLIKTYDEGRSDNITYNDKTRLFYTENKNSRIKRIFDENGRSNHFLCFVDHMEIERQLKNQNAKTTLKQIQAKINAKVNLLKSFGFIEARQYIKDNKLKQKTEVRVKTELDDTKTWIKLHNRGFDQHCATVDINTAKFDQDYKNKTVKVEVFDNFKDIIPNFSQFYVVKDDPKVKAFEKIRSPEQIHEQIKDKKFVTNHGNLTVDEILKHTKLNRERIEIQQNVDEIEFHLIDRVPKKVKRSKLMFIIGSVEGKPLEFGWRTLGRTRKRNSRKRTAITNKRKQIDDSLGRLAIVLMHELRQPKFEPDKDLDDYYQESLEKLNQVLLNEKLIGYDREEVDSYYSDSSGDNSKFTRLDRDQFDETKDFEDYLLKTEQIHKQVKNKTLRKLYGDHHQGTWKLKFEQVMNIQKQLRGKKN